MACRATWFNVGFAFVLGLVYLMCGRTARAETLTTVEVKPFSTLVSIVPGTMGYALEGEAMFGDHFAVVGGHSQARHRVGDDVIHDAQADDGASPGSLLYEKSQATLTIGARYYGHADDSWFAGISAGIARNENRWAFADERYSDNFHSYLGTLNAGYRWAWDSGFVVRAGVGLGASYVPARTVASNASVTSALAGAKDIRDEIEDSDPTGHAKVTPTLDFGLGYRF